MPNDLVSYNIYEQIIGCILQDPSLAFIARDKLKKEAILSFEHRKVYEKIIDMFIKDGFLSPFDPRIPQNLQSLDGKESSITTASLVRWRDESAPEGLEIYIEQAMESYTRLQISEASSKLLSISQDTSVPMAELLDKFNRLTNWLVSKTGTTAKTDIKTLVEIAASELDDRRASNREITGIQTGYYEFDLLIDGIIPGQYYVLGAHTSVGKTAMALNFILRPLWNGYRVNYYTLEMIGKRMAKRMIGIVAGINVIDLARNLLNSYQYDLYREAQDKLKSLNDMLNIYGEGKMQLENIILESKKKMLTTGLDLIIIDYLQQVKFNNSFKMSENERIQHVSNELQEFARVEQIPVIALSQFSREGIKGEKGQNYKKEPALWALRGSGAIEQDADVIIIATRDKDKDERVINYHVAKNRDGKIGRGTFEFDPSTQRISENRF